jgi:hypothetical protein
MPDRLHELSTDELRELMRSPDCAEQTWRQGMDILEYRERNCL